MGKIKYDIETLTMKPLMKLKKIWELNSLIKNNFLLNFWKNVVVQFSKGQNS
jgi:hypothetical protein